MGRTIFYKGSCHCGAVKFRLFVEPRWLVSCNCSICSRLGALWAHIESDEVAVEYEKGSTIAYSWAEETLEFHTCKYCGCTTHWENVDPETHTRMAVNFRMCSSDDMANFRIRILDGAETWKFLDK